MLCPENTFRLEGSALTKIPVCVCVTKYNTNNTALFQVFPPSIQFLIMHSQYAETEGKNSIRRFYPLNDINVYPCRQRGGDYFTQAHCSIAIAE